MEKISFVIVLLIFFRSIDLACNEGALWKTERAVINEKTEKYIGCYDLTNMTKDLVLRWYIKTNVGVFGGKKTVLSPGETGSVVLRQDLKAEEIFVFVEKSVNGKGKLPDKLWINLQDQEGAIKKYCVWDKYAITYKVKEKTASGWYKRKKKTASGWYCFFEVAVDRKNNKLTLTKKYDFLNRDSSATEEYKKVVSSKRVYT